MNKKIFLIGIVLLVAGQLAAVQKTQLIAEKTEGSSISNPLSTVQRIIFVDNQMTVVMKYGLDDIPGIRCVHFDLPYVWQPVGISTDWTEPSNWDRNDEPPATARVIIPKSSTYPVLEDPTPVDEILFEPGAELGRQDLLTCNKAFVQLDFSDESSRDCWRMLTNPLQQLYAGDFSFGGLPGLDMKTFVRNSGAGDKSEWLGVAGPNVEFGEGDSFEIWLSKGDLDHPSQTKGLSAAGGIITLPYFEDPAEKNVHWTQGYNATTNQSTFYGYNNVSFERTSAEWIAERDDLKAYQLVDLSGGVFTKTLEFGLGQLQKFSYAATGNPFMSSIDFSKLLTDNPFISDNYWIWIGAGASNETNPGSYATYNETAGTVGPLTNTLDQYIPPMQSFIVEVQDKITTATVTFDIESIGATGKNTTGLRAATQSSDLLEIIASTPQSAVRAVVASRENGSPVFNRMDANKFFAGINSLPDIYLLKPDAAGSMVAVGASVLNEIKSNTTVPLGISTTYEGAITLSFKGMDTYDARIFLNDAVEQNKIELTGKPNYEYTFNYVPERINGTAVSNENRFSIYLSSTNLTGAESVIPGNTWVYSNKPGTIQAISGEWIHQVLVFDMQGRKIYDNASVNTHEQTVTGLTQGVYIAKVVTENEVKTMRIIVK